MESQLAPTTIPLSDFLGQRIYQTMEDCLTLVSTLRSQLPRSHPSGLSIARLQLRLCFLIRSHPLCLQPRHDRLLVLSRELGHFLARYQSLE